MKSVTKISIVFLLIAAIPFGYVLASSKSGDKKVIKEKSFQISPGKKINIETDSGDIIVTTWNRSEVYVKIMGNQKAADKYDFTFNTTPEEITVIAERKGGWNWFSNVNIKIEIKVPENFNINANTSGGDIKIGGVNGGIYLKTSGGDIWGDRFEGNFFAKTSGGDINLYCKNAKIEASTSGGDIELEYTGINQGIELKTSGGDIDVKVPADFDAKAELKTSCGDVDCNLTLNNVSKLSESKIDANINKGGKPLIAITSGGDISVYKK
ncbi:MAG TPA: DUF4097 family beta strand repeat-containing protein [Ignavibacteriaceae bacterium]|nr:DUF4097 family beta strand repeat-containing protein [Ignavibacteriaceae bacterium]